ncbi:MAG: VanW family protein [Clostridia bacterium]|nr:VanW family protein [Clostridia bacterium]
MKGRKFLAIFLASAFAAGAFILCAFSTRLPAGTYVNGTYVGGMQKGQAVSAVRGGIAKELEYKSLTVHAGGGEYVFTYPEINFKDNAVSVVNGIKKSGSYAVNVRYYLNGINCVVSGICAALFQVKREPCAIFNAGSGSPFCYEKGVGGVYPDGAKLAADIAASLNGGFYDVYLHTRKSTPAKTLDEVRQSTVLLSAFTTYYDAANVPRTTNIALAAKRISGTIIPPHGSFSFNQSVGPRTKERGYLSAKVIAGGRYVYGVGGGVCQVSTTLYNAAVLAGLTAAEYHPHSLLVGYVAPSRDAMVSGTCCDLKLKNNSDYPAYIRILTENGAVRCEVYGKSDGTIYSLESELCEGDSGMINSRCYITKQSGDDIVTELLRQDSYLPYTDDAPSAAEIW